MRCQTLAHQHFLAFISILNSVEAGSMMPRECFWSVKLQILSLNVFFILTQSQTFPRIFFQDSFPVCPTNQLDINYHLTTYSIDRFSSNQSLGLTIIVCISKFSRHLQPQDLLLIINDLIPQCQSMDSIYPKSAFFDVQIPKEIGLYDAESMPQFNMHNIIRNLPTLSIFVSNIISLIDDLTSEMLLKTICYELIQKSVHNHWCLMSQRGSLGHALPSLSPFVLAIETLK